MSVQIHGIPMRCLRFLIEATCFLVLFLFHFFLQGHEKRRVVYNLYHIINHYVLFGGGYLSQSKSMIQQIMRM